MPNKSHPAFKISAALALAFLCIAAALPQFDWLTQIKNKPFVDARQYRSAPGTVTSGIQEAVNAAGAGGSVFVPAGTYIISAAIQVPAGMSFTGAGQASTIIKVANGALAPTSAWLTTGCPGACGGSWFDCVVCIAPASAGVQLANFTVDVNGANQPGLTMFSTDVTAYNCVGCLMADITVKNHQWGITGSGFAFWGTSSRNNVITRTTNISQPNCTVPTAGGGYYVMGSDSWIVDTYAYNSCDTDYVLMQCTHCSIVNGHSDQGTGQSGTPMYTVTGSFNTVSDSHCTSTGTNDVYSCFQVNADPGRITDGNVFSNNTADRCERGFEINSAFVPPFLVTNTVFSGGYSNCANGVNVAINGPANNTIITGMTLTNANLSFGAGISISSLVGQPVINNVTISNNIIDHNKQGIVISSATTGLPTGLSITNNFIGDTNATPVENYGISVGVGLMDNAYISGNIFKGVLLGSLSWANTWGANVIVDRNIGIGAGLVCGGAGGAGTWTCH